MSYRSDTLVKQFQNHYGEQIMIVPQVGTSNLLCSSKLALGTVLTEVKKLKDRLEESEYIEEDLDTDKTATEPQQSHTSPSEAFHTAKAIRKQLKSIASEERKRLKQLDAAEVNMDISYEYALKCVPNDLYNHIAWMLTDADSGLGPDDHVVLEAKQHEQVLDLSQDICAASATIM